MLKDAVIGQNEILASLTRNTSNYVQNATFLKIQDKTRDCYLNHKYAVQLSRAVLKKTNFKEVIRNKISNV